MSEHVTTVWHEATVLDSEPLPRRPWSVLGAVLGVVLVVDLALASALPPRTAPPLAFDGAAAARAELRAAAATDQAWLLIGDSVLAGDVMAGKVEGWQHERVVDHMQREQGRAPGSAKLFQVALDGLLPVDLLQVVRALDRVDPGGDVSLVVELNPRFFSPQYAEQAACTRPWLCELGPEVVSEDGSVRWDSLIGGALTDLRDAAAAVMPVARLKDRLGAPELPRDALLRPRAGDDDALSGRARLLAHYRNPALGPESVQVAALAEVVRRVRALQRRAVFFTTPIEDKFLAQARSAGEDGAYAAALSGLIEGNGEDGVVLLPLDHPQFDHTAFLDHCHLTPAGSRTLAQNLLHAMGLTLRERPPAGALVHPEDVDRTLVGRATLGHADGPAWHALFGKRARGVAVAAGGRRIVVADSENHVLRELVGDLHTVRTLAGAPHEPGLIDGPVSEARLQHPRAPWIAGADVYFADQGGTLLRRVRDGAVATLGQPQEPWRQIQQIHGHGDDLLVLDDGRRVVRVNVTTGATRVLARTAGAARIAAITAAPDGRMWLAQTSGQIFQGRVGTPMVIGAQARDAKLVFANTGKAYLPQRRGALFPLPFSEVRLDHPFALEYVARYDALLVADDVRAREPVDGYYERTQLRLLSLADKQMYPWIHGEVQGSSTYWNEHAEAYASTLHVGSLALEPESASLVYLEHDRSRLLWLSDGVWATAKVSYTPNFTFAKVSDIFGNEAGIRTQDTFRPDLYLPRRIERLARRGPYTGLIVTSSMGAMSQVLGQYALARRLERHLQSDLGTRDGVRFDLVHRAYSQPSFNTVVNAVDRYTSQSGRPDVILIEIHNFRQRFFRADVSDDEIRTGLQLLSDYAARSGALLLLFDNAGLIATNHDGLRASPQVVERAKAIARKMDIEVIELTDELLPRSLHEGVWGSPPMKGSHGSPYAIDATAALLAERTYPLISAHLAPGRLPALLSATKLKRRAGATLAAAFSSVAGDWTTLLPLVPGEAIQRDRGPDGVALFVDLKVAVGQRRAIDAAELERLAIASVYTALVRDGSYTDSSRVTVRLAWFTRHDEYGIGVESGAEVLLKLSLDPAGLKQRLGALASAKP